MFYYDLFEGESPSFSNRVKQSVELKQSVNQRRIILLSPADCIEAHERVDGHYCLEKSSCSLSGAASTTILSPSLNFPSRICMASWSWM